MMLNLFEFDENQRDNILLLTFQLLLTDAMFYTLIANSQIL